jgi:hypothetical protein
MAVVRITSELRGAVEHNVVSAFEAQRKAAAALPDAGDTIYERIMGPLLPQIQALPAGMFGVADSLWLRLAHRSQNYNISVSERFPLTKYIGFPVPINYTVTDELRMTNDNVYAETTPLMLDVVEQLVLRQNNMQKVQETVRAASSAVRSVLDSYATLAPALKAYPPLWDLLPAVYRDRHMEIVTKKPKVSAPDVSDNPQLQNLTARLIATRLTK